MRSRRCFHSQARPLSETLSMEQSFRQCDGRQAMVLYVAVYAVMTAVVLYPVLSVQVPALIDYLNHLARMDILYYHTAALSRFYQPHWQAIPYLVMDASFAVLSKVATIYNAGRIFVAICVILPVLSVMMLHFVVHRRLSLVPAAAFLFCYNDLLASGLLNYLPALCLAIMVFAGWIGSTGWPRWSRAVLFCVLATVVYLSHLLAFGAYGLAVGGFELGRAWRTGFRPWRVMAADWLVAGLQAVPAIVLFLSVKFGRAFVGPTPTSYGDLGGKLVALESPALFFGSRIDELAGGFALVVLILGLLTGRLRLAPAVWPAAVAVGVVAVCMPAQLFSVWGMDFRLPLLLALLLTGATSTTERTGRVVGGAVLAGFLLLTAVRSVDIAIMLRAGDRQIAEVRQVVAAMPRGMRLLIVDDFKGGQHAVPPAATQHVGMVAVIDRDAFVPILFTGATIVSPAPALLASSTPTGPPLHLSDLMYGLGRKDDPAGDEGNGQGGRLYWLGWDTKFDYVLIRHFGNRPAMLPPNLRLVATSSVADLYRIDRSVSP